MRPDILDALVTLLLQLDSLYLSVLVFSGIIVLSSAAIYLL